MRFLPHPAFPHRAKPAPRMLLAAAILGAATFGVGGSLGAPPSARIATKKAEAQTVLAQVNALDTRLGQTVEAWDGARYRLTTARQQLAAARVLERTAQRQQRLALARVRARLIGLYESTDQPTTIAILFGSATVSDLISQFSAANAVADADHRLAVETTQARDSYLAAERRANAVTQQRATALQQLSTQRAQIASMLGERRQLLSSIQAQLVTLKAEEARRQAALAAQARARLAREQQQLRLEAAARARAAEAARAKAAAAPPPTPTPAAPAQQPAPAGPVSPAPAPAAPPAAATPAPTPVPAAPAPGGGHPEAASIAMRYLGTPYVWGGASPGGFDCSGLVMYVFAQLGVTLPHYAAAQYGYGVPVARDQLQPGDLVFFDALGHVGIYIGGGQMIHAPHTGDVVKISPLSDFGNAYVGARRI